MPLAGCAAHYLGEVSPSYTIVTPQTAILATPNVKLQFVEDKRTMMPNEPFTPSRLSHAYWWAPDHIATDSYKQLLGDHGCTGVDHTTYWLWTGDGQNEHYVVVRSALPGSPMDRAGLVGANVMELGGHEMMTGDDFWNLVGFDHLQPGTQLSFKASRQDGSVFSGSLTADACPKPHPVKVEVAGQDKPLDGLMVFNRVPSTSDANVQRVWHVEIPDHYLAEATGGRVSVVFQPFSFSYQSREVISNEVQTTRAESTSWILWMSDLPLQ